MLTYLSLIVLLPLAAVASKAFSDGLDTFWNSVSSPQAVAALRARYPPITVADIYATPRVGALIDAQAEKVAKGASSPQDALTAIQSGAEKIGTGN